MMVRDAIVAWLFTLVVEVPIVATLYGRQWRRMAITAAVATSLTNLAMNLWWSRCASSVLGFLLVGELAALVIEAVVYCLAARQRGFGQALLASAVANSASFGLGIVATPILFGR